MQRKSADPAFHNSLSRNSEDQGLERGKASLLWIYKALWGKGSCWEVARLGLLLTLENRVGDPEASRTKLRRLGLRALSTTCLRPQGSRQASSWEENIFHFSGPLLRFCSPPAQGEAFPPFRMAL